MPRNLSLLTYALIAGLAILASVTHILEPLDRRILDLQFQTLRTWWPRPAAQEVVIVGIDEQTMKKIAEPLALWHRHLGGFLHAMVAGGASAVGMDVVLPDRTYDGILPGQDKELLTGILAARRVLPLVLALTVEPNGKPRHVYPAFVAIAGDGATGYALLRVDSDGVTRRFDENLAVDDSQVATLAGQLARRLGAEPRSDLIDFSRGAEFDYVALHTVLQWHRDGDKASLVRMFGGKPVLLGSVLKFEDRLTAPVALAAWEPGVRNVPGVLLHGQVLRNLLGSGLIAPVAQWVLPLLCLIAVLAWYAGFDIRVAVPVALAGLSGILALSTWALYKGQYLPVAAVCGGLLAATGLRVWIEAAIKLRERRKLAKAFTGYVSPKVMEQIMSGRLQPDLGGVKKFVCVMFSDIRGYTTLSEGMRPEDVIAFLNRYFEQAVNIIHAHGGTLVCFMGDGIMVAFGAPQTLGNPCVVAFAAAREILQYVRDFNAKRGPGEAPIEVGIGLHAGVGVAGHVGASSRHDYTVIGDVTNVAARLEGVTKEVGYRLVCSNSVAEKLPDTSMLEALGPQAIKGHTPVESYGYDRI